MKLPFGLSDRQSLARQLAETTIVSAAVRIGGIGLTFLVGVQLSRYLGPAGYGVYGTVMAIAALLIVPAQLGLPQLVTREIAVALSKNLPAEVKGVTVSFIAAVLLASVFLMGLAFGAYKIWGDAIGESYLKAYLWGISIVPLFALTNLAASILRGFHRQVLALLFEIAIRPALFACLLFVGMRAYAGLNASDAIAMQSGAAAIVMLLTFYCVWQLLPANVLSQRVAKYKFRAWGAAALPMLTTEIVRVVEGQYAILLLGLLVTIDQVGLFRVAASTAALLLMPQTLLNIVVMPHAAQLRAAGDTRRLQWLAASSGGLAFVGTITLTLAIYFFGETFLTVVFGKPYGASWPTLLAISVAYTISAYFGVGATILNMTGFEKSVTLTFAVGLVVGIPLMILLAAKYGIVGAGLAMIAAEIVKGCITQYMTKKALAIDPSAMALARLAFRK